MQTVTTYKTTKVSFYNIAELVTCLNNLNAIQILYIQLCTPDQTDDRIWMSVFYECYP